MKNNELIAEFMGAEFINDAPKYYPSGYYIWGGPFESDYSQPEDFEFHSSWDWLMPVVEKIETLKDYNGLFYEVVISSNEVFIHCENNNITGVYLKESKFKSIYLTILEFIKWYNKNKENESI